MYQWRLLLLLCTIVLVAVGCRETTSESKTKEKINVYTSIYPLEDFSKKIGGSFVEVTNIVPPGIEPHDFELTPRNMTKLSKADIFIYNGAGFENWAEKLIPSLNHKTKILKTTDGLKLTTYTKVNEMISLDPHVWLDPTLANQQAKKIKETFKAIDPLHKNEYEKNYQQLNTKFEQLDSQLYRMAKKAIKKEFFVSHAAFGYFAKRYKLKQIPLSKNPPMIEPNSKELKNIINKIKQYQVKYILLETFVNNKIAEVIIRETGVKALPLNPLEGLTKKEIMQKEDYFTVMEKNKGNLAKALGVPHE